MKDPTGRQKLLKGTPQLVGLTNIEYQIDSKATINVKEVVQSDMQNNYRKYLHLFNYV